MSFLPVLIALDANKDGEISANEINNAAAALKHSTRIAMENSRRMKSSLSSLGVVEAVVKRSWW